MWFDTLVLLFEALLFILYTWFVVYLCTLILDILRPKDTPQQPARARQYRRHRTDLAALADQIRQNEQALAAQDIALALRREEQGMAQARARHDERVARLHEQLAPLNELIEQQQRARRQRRAAHVVEDEEA